MKEISDTDAAYLAGLIDGEGCITDFRIRNGKKENDFGAHLVP